MEEDPNGQESSGTRGSEEGKGGSEQRWKEHWNEWQGSRTSLSLSSWFQSFTHCVNFFWQFQYNPEWFQDEEDGDASDDWDLTRYRREQEEDHLAAEELRIANLSLQSGDHEEITEGTSAGGGD
jgi:hypothetical protein